MQSPALAVVMNGLLSNDIGSTMNLLFDPSDTNRPHDVQPAWRGALRIALLQFALATSAFATTPPVAAAVDPPSPEHHAGKFVFAELVTPDLAAAKQFYGGLFGWRFHDDSAGRGHYAEATIDGRPVAGMAQRAMRAGETRQPAWLRFIAVGDIEATRKTAVSNGARLLSDARDVPGHGRAAVFADPQGAVFGVLAAPDGDPPDVLADPGEWIWGSLLTQEPDADAAFYQKVFDYDIFELPTEGDRQHLLLASEDYARGSVNTEPRSGPAAHPHWLHYVRVDDASAMVARAVALGGRVLVEPKLDRQGGKIAVVADPQGAPIGLLEWPNGDEQAVAP